MIGVLSFLFKLFVPAVVGATLGVLGGAAVEATELYAGVTGVRVDMRPKNWPLLLAE